jgi:hypothetical protein
VGKKIMRNRAHTEALAIFYLMRKWREIRREGRWLRGGGIDVLLEINDRNKCRTLLLRTTKTLAAYQLGKERSCKQLHTNETGRQQKQLVNVVINIINESGDFKSI